MQFMGPGRNPDPVKGVGGVEEAWGTRGLRMESQVGTVVDQPDSSFFIFLPLP